MIKPDIISDPICPWCFIGKSNLDAAIAETGTNPFDIEWHIFQLNPDMPPQGMDRQQYLEAKFGGPEGAKAIYDRIGAAAAAAALDLKFDRIARTPNTMDAHRLIRWAKAAGRQNELVALLFRRYFEEGVDISDKDELLSAAEAAGMERTAAAKLLDSNADRAELAAEDRAVREMGVTGVPTFIMGGKHVVPGAQPPELWARVIRELTVARTEESESLVP